jgi:ATP-dependent DNA ligase
VALGDCSCVPLAETARQRHIIADATEEVKLDGYRARAVKSGTGITLFSRRRKSLNRQFPYIVDALASLPEGTVVDGELVALDDSGRPDFNLLQNCRAEASRIVLSKDQGVGKRPPVVNANENLCESFFGEFGLF